MVDEMVQADDSYDFIVCTGHGMVCRKSFMALNRGMNAICQVDRKPNYLMLRLRGAVFALIFVLLVVASLVLIVFGTSIHLWIGHHFPFLTVITRILLTFRLLIMLVLFMVFFAVALYDAAKP